MQRETKRAYAHHEQIEGEEENRTPFTILVPILVICPLILSLLGLLSTNVLPGSIGASNA